MPSPGIRPLRCHCQFHGCHLIDGGREVNGRTLREHKIQDDQDQIKRKATDRFREMQKAQEDEIARNLEELSISNELDRSESKRQNEYRIDRLKKAVTRVSEMRDQITASLCWLRDGKQQPLPEINRIKQLALQWDTDLGILARSMKDASLQTLCKETRLDLDRLLNEMEKASTSVPASVEAGDSAAEVYNSDQHFTSPLVHVTAVHQLTMLAALVLAIMLRVSRRGCTWFFDMVHYTIQTVVLQALSPLAPDSIPAPIQRLLADFPRDIRSAKTAFGLDPKFTVYAVCPSCHATYAPLGGLAPTYAERCKAKKFRRRCGDLLTRPKSIAGRQIHVPIKPYVVYDVRDWIASMLSREGFEDMMDTAWNVDDPEGKMTSIFSGSVLRGFKGPDRKKLFSDGGDEGRYVFSLGADFYNPLTNKMAGKKRSVGTLILTCLNLPLHLRYKPENMFLFGLIPGPSEPPLMAVNPYLTPLVDILLEFWHLGVFFSKTVKYALGRLVRCALVALVCDLLAARKFCGFGSCNHNYFCAMCWCNRTKHGYGHADPTSWKRRTKRGCRKDAGRYRHSATPKEAVSHFASSGIRWTELLRLPYFDTSRFLVVDSMHNLFLGLIKEHFEGVLGGTTHAESFPKVLVIHVDPNIPEPTAEKEQKHVKRLMKLLCGPFPVDDLEWLEDKKKSTKKLLRPALLYVAKSVTGYQLPPNRQGPTCAALSDIILQWRLSQVASEVYPDEAGSVITETEILSLREDIQKMVTPSWVPGIPPNLGDNSGKLRADEWRTIGTLYLPVTLTRLWHHQGTDERSQRRRRLLDATLHLVSAINIATSRETSVLNAEEYTVHISTYVRELTNLYPEYRWHPNHHQAFHIADHLLNFGPVHGWWTFPFERVIGRLQRILTNYISGQYEATTGKAWHQHMNLTVAVEGPKCPPAIRHCVSFFRAVTSSDSRGTLSTDVGNGVGEIFRGQKSRKAAVPHEVQSALRRYNLDVPSSMTFAKVVHQHGVRYTTSSKHDGNSNVIVEDIHGGEWPASIIYIAYSSPDPQNTLIFLRRHQAIGLNHDAFQEFPSIRMKLWSPTLYDRLDVVPLSSIGCHFARLDLDWEGKSAILAVSLSKVLVLTKRPDENEDDDMMDGMEYEFE